jgi:hypothetical protein
MRIAFPRFRVPVPEGARRGRERQEFEQSGPAVREELQRELADLDRPTAIRR